MVIIVVVKLFQAFGPLVTSHKSAVSFKSDDVLSRNKRFLVYVPNGGTLKFVTGDI